MEERINIHLANDKIKEVHNLISEGQRINAIKLVRTHGKILEENKISLRYAKSGVDNLADPGCSKWAVVVPQWSVHSITVSGPMGTKINLDLDTLQMHFLSSLSTIGIKETNNLLDLVNYIQNWQGDNIE